MINVLPLFQQNDAARAPEPHVVMQMTVEDFVTLIHNYIQVSRRSDLQNVVEKFPKKNPSGNFQLEAKQKNFWKHSKIITQNKPFKTSFNILSKAVSSPVEAVSISQEQQFF